MNKFNELVQLCGINDIKFRITKEGETNSVEYNKEEKKFLINIPNDKDKEFDNLLDKKILELKEALK
jgi:hypothetical protein